ncbi:MAG TPA: arsenite efflux transporter metallochaperone ArsD [Gillisia sp.]|nr:arsenite efflux transporter metallochaperone ArsD [Gillisia sp.]
MKITILDPALCCSTGVCGPEVDDSLVQTAANVKWLKSLGVDVARHNISNDGEAFHQYPEAVEKLKMDGLNSLPYILKDGNIIMSGRYPEKAEWETILKSTPALEVQPENNSCCGGSSCC